MVRYYYTTAATFWHCHSSQADLDKSLGLENLSERNYSWFSLSSWRNEFSCLVLLWFFEIFILKFSFSSWFSRFSKQIIFSSRYTRFCPLFLILRKFTFLKVGGVFPPPPFGTRGVIFRMKDGILKLRPKGVDGCLMTGAIQDHFVGFRLMTILTGQSYISKVNIFCCDVKAEEQIISLILLSKLNNFLLLLQYSLSPLEIGERYLRFFFLLSKLEQRTILFSFRKCPQTTCKRRRCICMTDLHCVFHMLPHTLSIFGEKKRTIWGGSWLPIYVQPSAIL